MSFSIHAEVDKLRVMLTPGDKKVSRSVRSQRKECQKHFLTLKLTLAYMHLLIIYGHGFW